MRIPLSTLMPAGFFPAPLSSIGETVDVEDFRIQSINGGVEISLQISPSTGTINFPVGGDAGLILLFDQMARITVRLAEELRFEASFDQLTVQLPPVLHPASIQNGKWVTDDSFC